MLQVAQKKTALLKVGLSQVMIKQKFIQEATCTELFLPHGLGFNI